MIQPMMRNNGSVSMMIQRKQAFQVFLVVAISMLFINNEYQYKQTHVTAALTLSKRKAMPLSSSNKIKDLTISSSSSTSQTLYTSTQKRTTSSSLNALPNPDNSNMEFNRQQIQQPTTSISRPTITETEPHLPSTEPINLKPKILVLGATGNVGRRIVRDLIALNQDMTIVVFVRDYEKACDVLYDELIIGQRGGSGNGESSAGTSDDANNNSGPTVELVVGDLVPKQEVYGYKEDDDDDDDEDYNDDESYAASSASAFYNNKLSDYDFKDSKIEEDDVLFLDPNYALKNAMENVTCIISAVGAIRPTVPFVDYLCRPWRTFTSPRKWCKDERHPYYVNYRATKKVLEYAEEEQLRREEIFRRAKLAEKKKNSDKKKNKNNEEEEEEKKIDKIRIVRISDLCVANPPWDFVTLLTNIGRSLVFQSQERSEIILGRSKLVDSIILRPGDLSDDVRNETKVSLQVDITGNLPEPAYVGRDDVASLAVMAAVSDLEPKTTKCVVRNADGSIVNKNTIRNKNNILKSRRRSSLGRNKKKGKIDPPKHFTVAMRWAGESISQGVKDDGYKDANTCMEYIVKEKAKEEKIQRRQLALRKSSFLSRAVILPLERRLNKKRVKPYGFFVFLSMVLCIYPILGTILYSVGKKIPIVNAMFVWLATALAPYFRIMMQQIQLGMKSITTTRMKQILLKSSVRV